VVDAVGSVGAAGSVVVGNVGKEEEGGGFWILAKILGRIVSVGGMSLIPFEGKLSVNVIS